MRKRLIALIRKEFIQIRRDKRTLGMMIAIPLIWLTMFGYAATFDVKHIPLAIINQSSSELASHLIQSVKEDAAFQVDQSLSDRNQVASRMQEGRISLALIVPQDFGQIPESGKEPAQVEVMVDGADFFSAQAGLRALSPSLQKVAAELALAQASLVEGKIKSALKALGASLPPGMDSLPFSSGKLPVSAPKIDILYNPDLRSANVMIPGLTGLVILFITSMMTALGIVREKEYGTLEQIVVSPINPLELMLGKLIPYTLIGLFDFAIVVLAGMFMFDVPFTGNLWVFIGLAILFLLSTLGLGLLVSTLAQNQQQAIQMSMFMVFPQVLLSGLIFPLTAMPAIIRYIAYLFPLTYFMPIARGMFLKSAGLDLLYQPALLLTLYGIAMITFASIRFRRRLG